MLLLFAELGESDDLHSATPRRISGCNNVLSVDRARCCGSANTERNRPCSSLLRQFLLRLWSRRDFLYDLLLNGTMELTPELRLTPRWWSRIGWRGNCDFPIGLLHVVCTGGLPSTNALTIAVTGKAVGGVNKTWRRGEQTWS